MKTSLETIINPRNCKYTLNGVNLSELRRYQVRMIAEAMGIKETWEMSKNEMLSRLLSLLDSNGVEKELSNISGLKEVI